MENHLLKYSKNINLFVPAVLIANTEQIPAFLAVRVQDKF